MFATQAFGFLGITSKLLPSLWLPKIVSGMAQMPRSAILAWDA
jgi:hypothetical protein